MSETVDSDLEGHKALLEERLYVASQREMIWHKFKKHRLAIVGVIFICLFYLVAIFCDFIAPYDTQKYRRDRVYAPPQRIRFFDEQGQFHLRPFAYRLKEAHDLKTLRRIYVLDKTQRDHIYFFVRGDSYRFWNLFDTDLKLFGIKKDMVFLFGADKLGRDLFSRTLFATRISISIGLVGVSLSFIIGCLLGGISGFYGGTVDSVIQRVIEFSISIPTLPLWMALSAAISHTWSPLQVYMAITVILSLVTWGGLARTVRGKLLQLREEDYVMAAKVVGASERKIIVSHLIPGFMSYLIVSVTLAIPWMILGETSLSFLGLGLQPPTVSWGTLLHDAQNLRTIIQHPWLMTPGLLVVLFVLAFNFMGDGLRDAADPYK